MDSQHHRIAALEAALAACQAAPVAAGLTAEKLEQASDRLEDFARSFPATSLAAIGLQKLSAELQQAAARLEAAEGEASDG